MVYLAMLYSNIYRKYLAINTRIDEQLKYQWIRRLKCSLKLSEKLKVKEIWRCFKNSFESLFEMLFHKPCFAKINILHMSWNTFLENVYI